MLKRLFDWMTVIGLILLLGRILTAIFLFLDIPFTSFFQDYSIISVIILIIGLVGQQAVKDRKTNR
ncbi:MULTISPECIES: hypothetical protein [Oceanobacillus]|uniref:Uncharacterized protein n=1 Tax=Oceanobacillus profundus TaxID=372463 RepID=A0A417YIC5_9BACI|nr:hypothetical protein [Oceanobacillus profundus]MCM3400072.1 hypothetical protein [Oceanobacillus profundus]RHW32635.1 hypothetical protein D1B32_09920 [Oceanobacillus profundus]